VWCSEDEKLWVVGSVLGFEQNFALDDVIGIHAFAPVEAQASMRPIAFLSEVHFLTG
jgi:hypothetical protein